MTGPELAALLRSAVGWQSAIARRLNVDSRQVRRWLKAGKTPPWVDKRLAEWMGRSEADEVWPRDEWIIGDALGRDGRRREYIVHAVPPRFVARVVLCDDDGQPLPEEEPADILSGVVYSSGDHVLCEIDWIDQVTPGEVTQLLDAACDALERDDEIDS